MSKKTVKVKIAVGVDTAGNWVAHGWGDPETTPTEESNTDMMDVAIENIGIGEARYWIIAELEIPEPQKETEITAQKVVKVNNED